MVEEDRFCVTNISTSGSFSKASSFSLYLCEELEFVARRDILKIQRLCVNNFKAFCFIELLLVISRSSSPHNLICGAG